jgi:two-component system nitrogen regulation sensor histidine kinase NtrY
MTFRAKFLILFSLTVLAGSGLLAWGATRYARSEFARFYRQRNDTLAAQFQRELAQRGGEVASAVQGLADAESTLRMALDLGRAQADPSLYANDARGLAAAHQLDFLDLLGDDGTLISSAQWPARSGYKNDWVTTRQDWNQQGAFLQRVDLPEGAELGLLTVRMVHVGERNLYLIGGQRFDRAFLNDVALPAGTRALLYRNLETTFLSADLDGTDGPVAQAERFAPIIESAQQRQGRTESTIAWTANPASAESFVTLPLTGRQNDLLGVVLLGSAQRDLPALVNFIRLAALLVAATGILCGIFLSSWVSARVTRPLERLTAGARQVAAGDWGARVDVRGRDEAGRLAGAFNEMTARLSDERVRLVQTERVAAWRDLARRLAQEVRESLFPLQVTVDNLALAREQTAERFDELFFESMAVLRAELNGLKATVTRFSEFAKMPPPRPDAVNVNELVRACVKTFEPQFRAAGRPPITPELYLNEDVISIHADPDLLRKALENLLLYSIAAMPAGGALTLRTARTNGVVRIEVCDSGAVLKPEEAVRMFGGSGPRQGHGEGLGLPTTQAVVSDHGGRVLVAAAPGAGTTFRLEFRVTPVVAPSAAVRTERPRPEVKRELPEVPRMEAEPVSLPEEPSLKNE